MTWNPVRFVETLIHFRVAGPLKSLLDNVPFVSQALAAPALHTMLTPAAPPQNLLISALADGQREQLTAVSTALGYRVEAMANVIDANDPTGRLPLVNVPIVVWSPAETAHVGPTTLAELVSSITQTTPLTEATLVDLRHPTPAIKELWGSLDDVVMGGVSASQVVWKDGLVFTGNVSTANSGGFASIRTRNVDPPINLAQWQGTVLHVNGDGQRYKWILRDNSSWDSLAYSRSFDTMAGSLTTVRTPFQEMVATFRAKTKPDASPLNPSQICSLQLMLSKFEYDGELNPTFQAGEFKLEVSRIGVFREAPKPVLLLPDLSAAGLADASSLLAEANLTGIVPQASGFEVVGAGNQLPGWLSSATVSRLCQVFIPS
jgi:hypothetical protein